MERQPIDRAHGIEPTGVRIVITNNSGARQDPLTAYARLLKVLPLPTSVRQRYSGSFRLHSADPASMLAARSPED